MNRAFHLTSNLADTSAMVADAVHEQLAAPPSDTQRQHQSHALATAVYFIQ